MTIQTYEAPAELIAAQPTDPTGGRLVAWAAGLSAAHQIGTAVCGTSFVPKEVRGRPEEAAAAILFSGAAVDFISREAVRRSRSEVAPVTRQVQWSPAEAKPVQDEAAESFAAASGAAEER